jgi:glycosyltransferase involved in cell wall biosynthesis
MNIGQFNARGPNNGVEHWFDLIREELISRGHTVKNFWIKGNQPTKVDIEWMQFAIIHFSQVALYYRKMGVPFCILPSANDCFPDNGAKLKIASGHKNCKFVTYQSMYHKKKYSEWGIPEPYVYVPMPVRVSLFNRVSPLGKRIIAGGRLIPKKGLHRLKGVKNLTIFGDGPLRQELETQLPDAEFVGWLDGEQLKELMEDSWLFLCPSVVTPDGDSEGVPNILKEAMLMKLQCLCNPIAGIPELENIDIFSSWDNEYDINDAIEFMYKEPNWKGEQEIRNLYSPKHCVDLLMKGIEEYE